MTAATPIDLVQSIIDLTAQGESARAIAGRLGISARTVRRWRAKHALDLPPQPTTWQDKAACRGVDATWFVLDDDAPTGYARGRAVCVTCPARNACLNDALTREGTADAADRAGLWGGLSPEQRANLAAVRDKRARTVLTRTEEIAARHRDELLAALRETA